MLRLKYERTDRGLSIAAVSRATGVTRLDLSRIESGHLTPSAKGLEALSRYFGVPQDELLIEVAPHPIKK